MRDIARYGVWANPPHVDDFIGHSAQKLLWRLRNGEIWRDMQRCCGIWRDIVKHYEILRNIVSDADKIEALGEVGLERCFIYTREKNDSYTDEEVLADVRKHCEEKLLILRDKYIRTDPGKQLAEEGHNYIQQFMDNQISLCK